MIISRSNLVLPPTTSGVSESDESWGITEMDETVELFNMAKQTTTVKMNINVLFSIVLFSFSLLGLGD